MPGFNRCLGLILECAVTTATIGIRGLWPRFDIRFHGCPSDFLVQLPGAIFTAVEFGWGQREKIAGTLLVADLRGRPSCIRAYNA